MSLKTQSKTNNGKIFRTKQAFTLTEVLTSLAIIGVVAALTIPALMQKAQELELKMAWKKEYAAISNAYDQILAENHNRIKGVCTDNANGSCFMTLLKNKMIVQKFCDFNANRGICWHADNSAHNLYGGTDWTSTYGSTANTGMILNDGTLVTNWWPDGTCSNTNGGSTSPECGWLLFDVNGFKKPNIQGRDIFSVVVTDNKITPNGSLGTFMYSFSNNGCSSSDNQTLAGMGCSAKYLRE